MEAIANVPAGAWAVGVSGGADSVCLLAMLKDRSDLSLRVVHLDHETRGQASTDDAAFVVELAKKWGLPCTVAKRSEFPTRAAGNPSAQYREARFALFRREVEAYQLKGVILAHHADDQAETVLHRLLRGLGAIGLGGIRAQSHVDGLLVLHPLLKVRRSTLREELKRRGLRWREDASNESPVYLRNRLRVLLRERPALGEAMLELGEACGNYREALEASSPVLGESFAMEVMQHVPPPLARYAARRWLRENGAAANDLNATTIERLLAMATDAASPARQHFPGGLLVRRRRGVIFAERSAGGL